MLENIQRTDFQSNLTELNHGLRSTEIDHFILNS